MTLTRACNSYQSPKTRTRRHAISHTTRRRRRLINQSISFLFLLALSQVHSSPHKTSRHQRRRVEARRCLGLGTRTSVDRCPTVRRRVLDRDSLESNLEAHSMQSLTSAHPSLHSEARRPTPSLMDTIRARRGQRQRHARSEPDARRPSSRARLRIPGIPIPVPETASSRVRACMLWQHGAHFSLTQSHSPPHCCFSPTSLGPRHSESYSQPPFLPPTNTSLYLSAIPPPPRLGFTCLFVLGFRIATSTYSCPLALPYCSQSQASTLCFQLHFFLRRAAPALSTIYRSPSSCCIYCKPVCVYVYMYVRAALN